MKNEPLKNKKINAIPLMKSLVRELAKLVGSMNLSPEREKIMDNKIDELMGMIPTKMINFAEEDVKSAVEWLKKDLKDYFDLCKKEKGILSIEYIIYEIHQAFPDLYISNEGQYEERTIEK